jgi:hypothetical protein
MTDSQGRVRGRPDVVLVALVVGLLEDNVAKGLLDGSRVRPSGVVDIDYGTKTWCARLGAISIICRESGNRSLSAISQVLRG